MVLNVVSDDGEVLGVPRRFCEDERSFDSRDDDDRKVTRFRETLVMKLVRDDRDNVLERRCRLLLHRVLRGRRLECDGRERAPPGVTTGFEFLDVVITEPSDAVSRRTCRLDHLAQSVDDRLTRLRSGPCSKLFLAVWEVVIQRSAGDPAGRENVGYSRRGEPPGPQQTRRVA